MKKTLCAFLTTSLLATAFAVADASEIRFSDCTENEDTSAIYGAECGTFTLPENPLLADGKQLDINILRLPSIRESEKAPLFIIAGGPGQAASDLAESFRHQFSDLLIERDLIFVDQRGTGKSNPLDCDGSQTDYLHLSYNAAFEASLELMKECIAGTDADLRLYTTPHAVNDLELIRNAMGYQKIALWGGSYGTRVILEYLHQHSSSLEAVILDSIAPVQITLGVNTDYDASRALGIIFSQCEEQEQCKLAYPNLRISWIKLLNQLEKTPVHVKLKHPRTEKEYQVFINNFTLSAWVHGILYNRETSSIIPLILHQATQGDYSKLFSLFMSSREGIEGSISEMMQLSVLCAEDGKLAQEITPPKRAYERSIHLYAPDHFSRACALFPTSEVEERYFKAFKTDVPALLLSGNSDPITPPAWGEYVEPYFLNYQHIVARGAHHMVTGMGCTTNIIEEFLATPQKVSEIDAGCMENIYTSQYFVDNAGPALSKKQNQADDQGEAQ